MYLSIYSSINMCEYTGFDLMFGQIETPAEIDPESIYIYIHMHICIFI
jgi:hypothetical protein